MIQKVSFVDSTYKRLLSASSETDEPFCGLLIGVESVQSDLILGSYSFEQSHPKHFVKQFETAFSLLPLGYKVVGYYFKSSQADLKNVVRNLCKVIFPHQSDQQKCFLSNKSTPCILIGVMYEGDNPNLNLYWFDPSSQELSPSIQPIIMSEDEVEKMSKRYILCHLQARLPFSFHDTRDSADKKLSLEMFMSALALNLRSSVVYFKVESRSRPTKPLLLQGDDKLKAEKIRDHFNLGSVHYSPDRSLMHELLSVEVLTKMTNSAREDDETGFLSCVPLLHHDHTKCTVVKMELPLDILLLLDLEKSNDESKDKEDTGCDDDDDDNDYSDIFSEAIKKQLRSFTEMIISLEQDADYFVPRPYHFKVPDTKIIITTVYPEGVEEKDLASVRKELHLRFLVPLSTPVFRPSNQLQLGGRANEHAHLVDVHLGLPKSKANGRVTLLKGSYYYKHYMQDRMDDSGWGCAYRSLQTIASWLLLQGFTGRSPPTHVEIQKALVDIGDKPASFLNSRQWIGSTEVSYVLDHLYNVQSKICHVNNGGEMMSKLREIIHHFETQGTPIMIGGGALAHTIIGIDFNEDMGDVCYLVLDPHYTGPEDVKVIQNKGWCAWKGPEFWKANSFYNMCMPLKPSEF